MPTCVIGCWCGRWQVGQIAAVCRPVLLVWSMIGRTDSSSVPTCVIGCWCVRWQEGQIAAVCRPVLLVVGVVDGRKGR